MRILFAVLMLWTGWVQGQTTMRSVNFRDNVLWPIALKMGLDPLNGNFDDGEARAIGTYINGWVRRAYMTTDISDLKVIAGFTPISHIVPYGTPAGANASVIPPIGKVLRVTLLDPRTVVSPMDVPFNESSNGIYVGFDHGTNVWIEYMPIAPVYTAESWLATKTFGKGDVTYSPRSGECYKSTAAGNRNHDPAGTVTGGNYSGNDRGDLITEQEQSAVAYNPGNVEVPKVMRVYINNLTPGPNLPDPPPATNEWTISIFDADGVELAGAIHDSTGSESLAAILTDLRDQLAAILTSGWTFTLNTTELYMDIENASDFNIVDRFLFPPEGFPVNLLKEGVIQSYIPSFGSAGGDQQITKVTIPDNAVIEGATYYLTFVDAGGVTHEVSYVATATDSGAQIVVGLTTAIQTAAATDTFFALSNSNVDPSTSSLRISSPQASVDAPYRPPASPWWDLVPFPLELVDMVIRGANADVLKEWGQSDRGQGEEAQVPQELQLRTALAAGQNYRTLTQRGTQKSRYQVR
jgi:hypothetical protein